MSAPLNDKREREREKERAHTLGYIMSPATNPHRFESVHPSERPGHWGVPTSSLDWCERNYVVSPYVAEFWNTLSNASYVVVGLLGVAQCLRRGYEKRFVAVAAGVLVIGFGSAAFHGTLLYEFQLADELPMVWSMLCWGYAMYLTPVANGGRSKLLAKAAVLYAGVYSALHVYFAFTTVFQLMFAMLVSFGAYNLNRNCYAATGKTMVPFTAGFLPAGTSSPSSATATQRRRQRSSPRFGLSSSSSSDSFDLSQLHVLCVSYLCLLLFAVSIWLLDQFACTALHNLPFGLPNPQLHAWWHVLTAVDTHIGLQLAIGLRAIELQKRAGGKNKKDRGTTRARTKMPKTTWYAGVWANVEAEPMDGE